MDQEFNEDKELNAHTLRKIEIIIDTLNRIIIEMNAPIDPKAIALLEMAVDMLEEQVIMDKTYDYPDCMSCDGNSPEKPNVEMMFFNNKTPSVDDLNGMFDMDWTKDDDK